MRTGPWRIAGISPAAILFVAMLAVLVPAGTASAQETANLVRQIERLRRDLNDLQKYVYRGEQPPASSAAGAGDGALPTDVAARMQVQITQMQEQMRSMNGRVEEVQHRIGLLEQRLERLSADLELRLQAIETAIGGGAGDAAAGADRGNAGAGTDVVAPAGVTTVPPPPEGASPQEQYDYAYDYLKNRQYERGRLAMETFMDRNPDHDMADNAAYWIGETHYVERAYKEAAKAFLDGYRRYPNADKAPDNLLKLGKSLAALGETDSACKTYAKLLETYPGARPGIINLAKSEQKKLDCN